MIKKLTYLYISVKVKFRVFVQVNNNIKRIPNLKECSGKISLEGVIHLGSCSGLPYIVRNCTVQSAWDLKWTRIYTGEG